MTDYHCAWEITVEADSPREAALHAERLMAGRSLSCWTVTDETDGQQWTIEAIDEEESER